MKKLLITFALLATMGIPVQKVECGSDGAAIVAGITGFMGGLIAGHATKRKHKVYHTHTCCHRPRCTRHTRRYAKRLREAEVEAYLAQATDHVDLENRMKQLKYKGIWV